MMLRKSMLILHTLLILAFLLAACSGGGEATEATSAETPPGEEGGAATEAPAVTDVTAATEVATEAMTEAPAATEAVTEAAATTEAPTETEAATEAAGVAAGGEGALVSVRADEAPELDGAADDAAWQNAEPVTIPVSGGVNTASTEVAVRSVYTDDTVYFLVTWADPTQSWLRSPWEKQQDGTWAVLKDPNDRGGDNNLYYEDKLAFIWPVNNSIPNFETQGCFTACHAGENSDAKPYGNKYTAEEGQVGDIWHWKSVRNVSQVDDQYLDHTQYSEDTPEAGRHSDPNDGGGYQNNETEDKTMPAFIPPDGGAKDGSPGFILEDEAEEFDDSLFQAGDRVPGVVVASFEGDRGDLSADWQYADGMWTLEFSRPLTTDSEFDVQFDDMAGTYYFALATFDNAQVRHAFQGGATAFTFQEE